MWRWEDGMDPMKHCPGQMCEVFKGAIICPGVESSTNTSRRLMYAAAAWKRGMATVEALCSMSVSNQ